jgi:hypothetical protein
MPSGRDPPSQQDLPTVEDVPPPGDADAPRDEDDYPCAGDGPVSDDWLPPGQDDDDDRWPAADWPGLPAVIPPAFARPGAQDNRASTASSRSGGGRSGLLDVSLPWQVLAGISAGPGHLGRIGPVTATQARRIAQCAVGDPGAEWRIIVTTPEGVALAVTRIPRPRDRHRAGVPGLDPEVATPAGIGAAAGMGLVSRVTLMIPEDLAADPPQGPRAGLWAAGDILDLAVRAAARAAAGARAAAAADAAAGGCAHGAASSSYRPPPRLQDYIAARDLTCRFLRCRQPAWRGDLDHTIVFDDGGLTCRCNLGGLCRLHHIIKHHPDWKLEQIAPGIFRWTTPSGRTFTAIPDTHFV